MGVEGYNKQQMERLKDYKVAFDQEAMWARLQEKKKKRRGALFFMAMALVALAIAFMTAFLWSMNSSSESEQSLSSSETNQSQNQTIGSTIGENESTALTTKESLIADDANASKSSADVKANGVKLDSGTQNHPSDQDPSRVAKTQNGSIGGENDITAKTKRESNQEGINNKLNRASDSTSESSGIIDPRKWNGAISTGTPNGIVPDVPFTPFINTNTLPQNNKAKSNTAKTKTTKALIIAEMGLIELDPLESSSSLASIDNLTSVPPTAPIIEPVFDSRWSLGLYGGLGKASRAISIANSEEQYQNQEETLEEVSVGLDLKYQLTDHLYAKAGLEYWHVTDRATYSSSDTTLITEENREMFDVDEGIVIENKTNIQHTMYRTLNVPLMLGYTPGSGRFDLFAEAGILANVDVSTRGINPSPTNQQRPEEFIIGRNTRLSPVLGLGVSYGLTDKVSLFGQGQYRSTQPVNQKPGPELRTMQQSYSAIRGQVGLRFKF